MFKIMNDLTPPYLKNLIPPRVLETTQYNLRNRSQIRIPLSRANYCHTSFVPATLKLWNALDPEIKRLPTINRFKAKLKFRPNPLVKLFSAFQDPCHIIHTQIRLGLSPLKIHLFTHSIILEPFCQNCQNNVKETTLHYFLQCPAFAAPRGEMTRGLRDLVAPGQLPNNKNLVQMIIHGDPSLDLETNKKIFILVHRY
jgi:hypothetical protein